MSGKTPNLDRLAAGGMRFTDYYAFNLEAVKAKVQEVLHSHEGQ